MAAKPTTLPRWGETAAGAVGPTETVPSSGKLDVGWAAAEEPPAGYMNWLQRLAYKWLQYVSDAVFVATVASGLAGLDATGDGAAPGVRGTGGATGPGGAFTGGATGSHGATSQATGTGNDGHRGTGITTGSGLRGTGGVSGPGVSGVAGGGGTPVRGALELVTQATPSAPLQGDLWNDGTNVALAGPIAIPAASDYKYRAARPEIYHVAPEDFVATTNPTNLSLTASIVNRVYDVITGSGASAGAWAKVRLPQGATITGLQLLLGQSGTGATNATVYLIAKTYLAAGSPPGYTEAYAVNGVAAAFPVSGLAGTFNWAWVTVAVTTQVVPSDGYVDLQVLLPLVAAQFSGIGGARITYTVPHLKPAVG